MVTNQRMFFVKLKTAWSYSLLGNASE